jgi:hypothetical protein
MSTELHTPGQRSHESPDDPRHNDVSFESRDVKVGTIYAYLAFMAIAVGASFIICIFILKVTTKLSAQSDTPPPAVRQELKDYSAMPPEPRLQGIPGHDDDAQADLRTKIKEDTAANEKYQWIDRNAGTAQIPVKDAMKIIAEKGFPALAPQNADKQK